MQPTSPLFSPPVVDALLCCSLFLLGVIFEKGLRGRRVVGIRGAGGTGKAHIISVRAFQRVGTRMAGYACTPPTPTSISRITFRWERAE